MRFIRLLVLSALWVSATSYANLKKAEVQAALTKAAKSQNIPGALALIQSPTEKILATHGTTELGQKQTPRSDTYFRIGSNTKSMICAVIVQLAQEGAVKLEDPISKYVPRVPNGNQITLDLLMKNRTGLYNYLASPKFSKAFDKNPSKNWTPEDLLKLAFDEKPLFAPNKQWDYSNTNFILLGLVAEKLDKKSLPTIFKERLFDPLGMKHTYLPTATETKLKVPYSHGYVYGQSSHVFTHQPPYSAETQLAAKTGKIKPKDYTVQSPSWAWAAGGVVSNAEDVSIWIKALSQGELFNKEFYKKWLKSPEAQDPNDATVKYGYGFMTVKTNAGQFYFHNGELPGFSSYMIYDPIKERTLVVWSNLAVSLKSELAVDALKSAVFDVLYQKQN